MVTLKISKKLHFISKSITINISKKARNIFPLLIKGLKKCSFFNILSLLFFFLENAVAIQCFTSLAFHPNLSITSRTLKEKN